MPLNERRFADLAQHFEFKTWRDATKLGTNLFIWNFFMTGKEFTGWSPSEIETIQPREERRDPLILSVWQRYEGEKISPVSMEVYECADRIAAHKLLLENLSRFQSPNIVQLEETKIGDVVFGNPSHHTLLFARANLVVLLMNASRNLVPVDDFARSVDSYLAQQPSKLTEELTPRVESFKPTLLEPAPLNRSIWQLRFNELPSEVWYKFYSTSGEVHRIAGQLHYHPGPDAEPSELTIFAVSPDDGAGRRDLII